MTERESVVYTSISSHIRDIAPVRVHTFSLARWKHSSKTVCVPGELALGLLTAGIANVFRMAVATLRSERL